MFSLNSTPARQRVEKRTIFRPPTRGLNADSIQMGMNPADAVILENFVPYADRLETRPGYEEHATGFVSAVRRVFSYVPSTGTAKLFASTDSGVFDITTAGAIGGAAVALTNGKIQTSLISTGAGSYLILVNGTDSLLRYDGSSWTSVATLGSTSTSDYSYVELYRQRLYFAKKNSRVIEYLPVNSISGTPTSYDLGAILRRGGYIVSLATWTIDSGTGPDDYFAVLTSEGEVAVFVGNDPASLATWSLRGVFYIGQPLGDRPMTKYGGDLLVLTENGLYPLSLAVQSTTLERQTPISLAIRRLFTAMAKLYRAEYGWCMTIEPDIPALIVNIPSTPRQQFVQNLQTGAWTIFKGWEAVSFERLGSSVYFATETFIGKIDGANDSGANITAKLTQAYTRMSEPRDKMVKLLRPYFTAAGGFYYTLGIASDFVAPLEVSNPNDSLEQFPGVWDASNWGQVVWARSSGATVEAEWYTVPDEYSTWKAFSLEVRTNAGIVTYAGADVQYIPE